MTPDSATVLPLYGDVETPGRSRPQLRLPAVGVGGMILSLHVGSFGSQSGFFSASQEQNQENSPSCHLFSAASSLSV